MRAKKDAHSEGKVPREMGAGRGRVDGKARENHTVAKKGEWTKPQGSGVNNALIVPKRLDFPRGGPGGRRGAAGERAAANLWLFKRAPVGRVAR